MCTLLLFEKADKLELQLQRHTENLRMSGYLVCSIYFECVIEKILLWKLGSDAGVKRNQVGTQNVPEKWLEQNHSNLKMSQNFHCIYNTRPDELNNTQCVPRDELEAAAADNILRSSVQEEAHILEAQLTKGRVSNSPCYKAET